MARANFWSTKKATKKNASRSAILESLEDRRVLALANFPFNSCVCPDPVEETPSHDVGVNKNTGNASITAKSNGPGLTNNSGTNPHPIVRFVDANGVSLEHAVGVYVGATDYIKATLYLSVDGEHDAGDPHQTIYVGNDEITTAESVLFTFQLDATSVETGRYPTWFEVDYYHSNGTPYDHEESRGPDVNIVNRAESEFGNRWWLDDVDKLVIYPETDPEDAFSDGALYVRSDGMTFWYGFNGTSMYDSAAGDPDLAKLEDTGSTLTLSSRDGSKRVFDELTGKLIERYDPAGNKTTYTYDFGTLTRITDQAGHQTRFEYYSGGSGFDGQLKLMREVLVVDVNDAVVSSLDTEYTYESRSSDIYTLTSITRPDPDGTGPLQRPRTDYTYTSYDTGVNWLLASLTESETPNELRSTMRFTYDFAGRVDTITHFDGTVETLDPIEVQSLADLRVIGSSPATRTTFRTEIPAGRQTDRNGHELTFKADHNGHPTQSIDQSGYAVEYENDPETGQLTKIEEGDTDGVGTPTTLDTLLDYDGNHALSYITFPDGSSQDIDYDSLHRLTQVKDEVGRLNFYCYNATDCDDSTDPNRLPLYVQQIVGAKDTITYNTSTGGTSGASDDLVWSFKYTTTSSPGDYVPGGLPLFAYDPLGRKSEYNYVSRSEVLNTAPNPDTYDIAKVGMLDYIDLPKLGSETNAPRVDYSYDINGNVSAVTNTGDGSISKAIEYLHDAFGRLLTTTMPDPDGAGGGYDIRPTYRDVFDGSGRLMASAGPDVSVSGSSSAPTRSPTTLAVNVAANAGNTEIDLTEYFSDDADTDYGLTYVVTTSTTNNTPEVLKGVYLPSNRPGMLVLDTEYYSSGGSDTKIEVRAVDSHGNTSSPLEITVTVTSNPEFILNSTTADTQRKPSLAAMPGGGFVAAWLEKIVSTGEYNVKARVFGSDGRPITGEVTVQGPFDSTSSTYSPAVTVTEDGHIVVAWHELTATVPVDVYDCFFSRYTLGLAIEYNGVVPLHQRVAIPSDLLYDQFVPTLAPLPRGGFVAAFYGGSFATGTTAEVWYRRFGADAEVIDANQVQVNVTTSSAQYLPSIDVAGDGSFVVAWQGKGTGDLNGAFARKFGVDGVALRDVESLLYDGGIGAIGQWQLDTDVAALADGSFVIVFSSDESAASNGEDVFYRRMDAQGFLVGADRTLVNSSSTADQKSPAVAALPSGGFVVTWHAPDASSNGIYFKSFDASYSAGAQNAVNVTSSAYTNGEQYYADVIVNPDGNPTFAWEGSGTGDSTGIFARYYPLATASSGPFRGTNVEMDRAQRNKIDSFIVTFSEAIDDDGPMTTSLNGADFVLKDRDNNTVALHGTTPIERISANQALVRLAAPLSTKGLYTLTVGPSIKRLSDNDWMNGDGDGSPNETEDHFVWTFVYATGAITTYQYDDEHRLIGEIDAMGSRSTYDYSRMGDLTSATDPLGATTRYEYDERGLLTKAILPDPDDAGAQAAPEYEYHYDDAGQLQTFVDAIDAETDYEYDTRHRLIEILEPDPDGNGTGLPRMQTKYAYTKAGELAVVTDSLGRLHTSTYDDARRLIKSSLLADTVTVTKDEETADFLPDPDNTNWPLSTSVTGAVNGDHRVSNVSGAGNRTATWEVTGLTKDKTYEIFVTWVADSTYAEDAPYTVYDGTTAGTNLGTFTVDQTKSPSDNTDVYADVANVKWHSLGDFKVTNGTTPGTGKLTVKLANTVNGKASADAIRVVETSPTRYSYERSGSTRINKTKDALNNITEERFDARDRRTDLYLPNVSTGAADQSGPHTTFGYDPLGNLTSLTDPSGNVTSWAYDQMNRVTSETDDYSNARQYKYDDSSNVNKIIDRLGRVRTFEFDRLSRNISEQWFANISDVTADRTITYGFDRASQLTTSSDAVTADFAYAYDKLGRMTQSTTDLVGLATSQIVYQEFAYNANSLRTEAKASYGTTLGGATKDYKNTYVYNTASQLTQITQQGQSGGNTVGEKRVDYTYDAGGARATVTRYKALAGGSGNKGIDTAYTFDDLGRLTSLVHGDAGTVRASYDYTFDAMGRIRSLGMVGTSEDVTSYSYDTAGQLTAADWYSGTDESYTLDANGNRTNVGGVTWTVSDDNRINRDGTYEYTYDAEGNLWKRVTLVWSGSAWVATGATTEFAYDHRNRLTSVTEKTAPSGGTTMSVISYGYDAFDRRVSRREDNIPIGTLNRGEFYIWDGDDVVLDFVDATGSGTESLDRRYLWGLATDEILADEPAGGSTRWMLGDRLGTVRDLANGDGDLINGSHVVYNSFGKIVSGTPATRFSYTSQEYDDDTGLYYYNARWYDAKTGRFMTKDPIGFNAGDTNQYRYVGNDAVNASDPSGLESVTPYQDMFWKGVSWTSPLGLVCGWDGNDYRAMFWNPIDAVKGGGEGAKDGLAMAANAATFHQIPKLDRHVDDKIRSEGGAYSYAYVSAHVGVYAAYLAGAIKIAAALGAPATAGRAMSTAGRAMTTAERTQTMRAFFQGRATLLQTQESIRTLLWYRGIALATLSRYAADGYTGGGIATQTERLRMIGEQLSKWSIW